MLKLCGDIGALYKEIGAHEAGISSAEDKWAKFHKEHCLIRDDAVLRLENSVYSAAAAALRYSEPGRMKKLVTGIANMSTSLPPGIFVRVGESRPDVEVSRHGPSRYAICCLSLLGTWPHGDQAAQWQPNKSTILSVLISLQAMVLSEDPYRQEPGQTRRVGKQADIDSLHYILYARPLTVRYAMLEWLQDSGKRNGIWRDVINAHFGINKEKILQTVTEWVRQDPSWSVGRAQGISGLTRGLAFPGELKELEKLK
ncbi:hypothetical protein AJ79_07871 [Helicocarpus griseus UAMH5409]|uniref:Uncharacterized protein n=1 Tax=Helicocarpus griseus UAMH5409 TaxID=1447875 RepID=A0A2B7WYH7_9EURO|nr:hypothetical protein AJ79_07871 [Helicocarpus griseus UAMH5409]